MAEPECGAIGPAQVSRAGLRRVVTELAVFSRLVAPRHVLRGYQLGPGQAILDGIGQRRGEQFVVVFSRQAGKDELLAQLMALLLVRYQRRGGNMVLAAPSFRPQAAISRDRLLARLTGPLVRGKVEVRDGSIVRLGQATARFLSAAPTANARGQTADLLLIANEAQDIQPDVWDAVFDPMAASTNAVTVFAGTVWSRETLLARQMRHLERLEAADGRRRVWRVPWDEVAQDVPPYGDRVRARIAQLGASHPFVQTEYFLRELEGDGGLFPPHRLAQLRGSHPRQHRAEPGSGNRYALLIDVAGEVETPLGSRGDGAARGETPLGSRGDGEARGETGAAAYRDEGRQDRERDRDRDSTALTVVEVETPLRWSPRGIRDGAARGETPLWWSPGGIRDGAGREEDGAGVDQGLPRYKVVDRMLWTGVAHTALHAQLVDLARTVWRASVVVIDATGIGAGLASFLAATLGRGRPRIVTVPFVFTAASKSALGWDFLGLIDSGRLKEYADDGDQVTRLFWQQLANVTYEIGRGPDKPLRWSVPAGRGHDDLVMSAALVARLDELDWRARVALGS